MFLQGTSQVFTQDAEDQELDAAEGADENIARVGSRIAAPRRTAPSHDDVDAVRTRFLVTTKPNAVANRAARYSVTPWHPWRGRQDSSA